MEWHINVPYFEATLPGIRQKLQPLPLRIFEQKLLCMSTKKTAFRYPRLSARKRGFF
jgi:hypothetical protein